MRIFTSYSKMLRKYPVATKATTTGLIALVGDLGCQKFFPTTEKASAANKTTGGGSALDYLMSGFDKERALRFAIVGTFVIGPSLHFWFSFLGKRIPGSSLKQALRRTAVDQGIFAPFMIASIISSLAVVKCVQENSWQVNSSKIVANVRKDLDDRWVKTLYVNYYVWIPAQILNFWIIPVPFMVLFNNFIALGWNGYLSYSASQESEKSKL